jgi:8-oxo-dGTP diphosphatase
MELYRLDPNAVVAVDVVVFTLRPVQAIEDQWQVLLVRRDEPAFGDKLSLPGVLVRAEETFDQAARRALETKAGLDAREWYLEQLGTFGDPGRDTRGRVVSVAHVALVRTDDMQLMRGSGIVSIDWMPVRRLPAETLAFDHADMLRVAINRVQA